jgi:triphosphoribosyl-dephospho-CoA synthase
MSSSNKAKNIARCLELAVLLEASAHKPGNVSVVTDFENTRYEHFLASAVAAASSFEFGAHQGVAVSQGKLKVANIRVGNVIKNCVADIDSWQHGGNTLLGTVILLCPMAVAAGVSSKNRGLDITSLRNNLKIIVESTTPEDAIDLYAAIEMAKPGGLGKASDLDVMDPDSRRKIHDERITLYQVFRIAEKYDSICSEWVNNYHVTFDIAYPSLNRQLKNNIGPSRAVIQTFLEVLAHVPDTFISRKAGTDKANEVSEKARNILELGGVDTPRGRKKLSDFDHELRRCGNLLNPGTTADLIAAALAVCVLDGYRP